MKLSIAVVLMLVGPVALAEIGAPVEIEDIVQCEPAPSAPVESPDSPLLFLSTNCLNECSTCNECCNCEYELCSIDCRDPQCIAACEHDWNFCMAVCEP
jgi:hypothetical protein